MNHFYLFEVCLIHWLTFKGPLATQLSKYCSNVIPLSSKGSRCCCILLYNFYHQRCVCFVLIKIVTDQCWQLFFKTFLIRQTKPITVQERVASPKNMSTQPLTLLACDWPVQTEAIIKFSVRHKQKLCQVALLQHSKALHYVKYNLLGRTEYLHLSIDSFPLHSGINPDLPMRRGGGRGGGKLKTPGGTWVNFCWVCATGFSRPLPHYSLFCSQF